MLQTVFAKDKPIYLSNHLNEELMNASQLIVQYNGESDIELTVKLFEDNKNIKSLLLHNEDFEALHLAFISRYKTIEAAGGLVFNTKGEALLIHRYERWDLPKGKLEINESPEMGGVREVEEECGIKNIKIEKTLQKTYHCFEHNGEKTMKITHWYKMICTDENPQLTPQTEEGITDVKWFKIENLNDALKTAYGSVLMVVQEAIKG